MKRATRVCGATTASLELEAETLVELRRGLVEGEHADIALLVAAFEEVVPQDETDRVGCVALPAGPCPDRNTVGEPAHARIAMVRGDRADELPGVECLDLEKELIVAEALLRHLPGPLLGSRE